MSLANVALTEPATVACVRLQERLGLREKQDVVRLCVAVGLRERLTIEEPDPVPYDGSNFQINGLDPDGELRRLVRRRYSLEEGIDETLRILMSASVLYVADAVDHSRFQTLEDIILGD